MFEYVSPVALSAALFPCGKDWKCHRRKNGHPHPSSFSIPHGTQSEDLPAHTCWVALVFSIFDHAGFFRITTIAVAPNDTVLLTHASFGAVWSYPGLPSLDTSCVNNMLINVLSFAMQ